MNEAMNISKDECFQERDLFVARGPLHNLYQSITVTPYPSDNATIDRYCLRRTRLLMAGILLLLLHSGCENQVLAQNYTAPATNSSGNHTGWRNPSAYSPTASAPRSSAAALPRNSSSAPSVAPFFSESSFLSNFPTPSAPSNVTTAIPSAELTNVNLTFNPTIEPSKNWPSTLPTVAPNPISTLDPTADSSPTQMPSKEIVPPSPTRANNTTKPHNPTVSPSISLTVVPTDPPSTTPTVASPSSIPTITESLELQKSLVNVIMLLSFTSGKLSSTTTIDFAAATEAHIKQSTEALTENDGIINLTVKADVNNQRIVESNTRRLQELVPLQVAFDVLFTFQSPTLTYNTSVWVKEAFNSKNDRKAYIDRLQQRDPDFLTVSRIDVMVNGDIPDEVIPPVENPTNLPTDTGKDSSSKWIIIGASVGGGILLLVLVFFFCQSGGRKASKHSSGHKKSVAHTSIDETSKMGYAAEINVDRQDDISTLGDPVYGGHVGRMFVDDMEQRDDYTATVGPDYDYSKHYLATSGSAAMEGNALDVNDPNTRNGFPSDDPSVFKPNLHPNGVNGFEEDDGSIEEQYNPTAKRGKGKDWFEIEVPPGKLGMVIDTPNNGVPVVHAIKQNSVLCDRVQVGDYLVSVDGEDVTSMSAIQVSKLISLKSDQRRLLVFRCSRTINTTQSNDSFDP